MLFLLSPAKTLDYESAVPADLPATEPLFGAQTRSLIALLRQFSSLEVAQLMSLSDTLAELNVARYRAWSPRATARNARQAVLAFAGDVYGGLDAYGSSADDLMWAQEHLAILSGLYGVLRPLDLLQPYRLEMGTRLANPAGGDLYHFWQPHISSHLNRQLQSDATPVVINLASQEYAKAVDRAILKARVIDCVFQEWKAGQYKIVSFHAKRARGLLARFAIASRATLPHQLEAFDAEGYRFAADASGPDRMVFRRRA